MSSPVVPTTPVHTGGGCSPAPRNFPEHLQSPLLGPSFLGLHPAGSPEQPPGQREQAPMPTPAAGPHSPLLHEPPSPAASPGVTAHPSAAEPPDGLGCPCTDLRTPGSQPTRAHPRTGLSHAAPSLRVPGYLPARLDSEAGARGSGQRRAEPRAGRPEHVSNDVASPKTGNGRRTPSVRLEARLGAPEPGAGGSWRASGHQQGEVTAPGPRSALGAQDLHSLCPRRACVCGCAQGPCSCRGRPSPREGARVSAPNPSGPGLWLPPGPDSGPARTRLPPCPFRKPLASCQTFLPKELIVTRESSLPEGLGTC